MSWLSGLLSLRVANRRNRVVPSLCALLLLAGGMAARPAQAQITATYQNASVLSTGAVTLHNPFSSAVDGAGDVYIADSGHNQIVEVSASGAASVVPVGSPGGLTLVNPSGVAVDQAGDLYIADTGNSRIVEYSAGGVASVVSTGTLAHGSTCTTTPLCYPVGVAVDSSGDLFISDTKSLSVNRNSLPPADDGGGQR